MYCARCGVELQKGIKKCPLCGLEVHPLLAEAEAGAAEALPYPRSAGPEAVSNSGLLFIVSFIFMIPLVVCFVADISISGGVSWSGYVAGGLLVLYSVLCLPHWFKDPNPVIFFPVSAVLGLCLALYICIRTGGDWFLSFAFPAGGAFALIIETEIILLKYAVNGWRHRVLYIVGAALIALGLLSVLIEFLIKISFGTEMVWWSVYPLTALSLLGLMMIITGVCRPLRESLYKKLFI